MARATTRAPTRATPRAGAGGGAAGRGRARGGGRGAAARRRRAATTRANGDDDDATDAARDDDDATDKASLATEDVLQFREVCAQARAFAATTRGRRAASGTTLAATADEARARLARTRACFGRGKNLDDDAFDGARDVRLVVEGARRGTTLAASSLGDVGATCGTQRRLGAALRERGDEAMREIEEALMRTPLEVVEAIERCVSVPGGEVLDAASETLRAIRVEQRRIREELRTMLNATSKEMARKNFAERAQIVTRLGRQCIPMKLGSAGELPGVVLDVSGTGNTVFKEPQIAVPLNNALATLSASEDAEIERILVELTSIVQTHADVLLDANEALTELDVANARARHAEWFDGAEPTIVDANQGMCVRELQHPLLLERHLTPLPKKAAIGEEEQVSAFGENDASEDDSAHSQRHVNRRDVRDVVVPIDFNVDSSIKCVAITGPNTGGKTASLKAIGVACLMARAGLYLPCESGCEIPFFRHVIADLGDSQTLELDGGLSTFGAHLKGLQRILDAATDDTLVLLDEPGSGTDPAEGASLAVAVLNKLSRTSRLTIATSHYEEVKEATLASDTAQVAAVEFDLQSLQPTYRLLWGETGKSNALHIAAGLGLEPWILAEARIALAKADANAEVDASGAIARENRAKLASALDEECDVQLARRAAAAATLEETRALFDEVRSKSAHLDLRKQIIRDDANNEIERKIEEARELLAACDTREDIDDVVGASLPAGWVVDASGEAVPGDSLDSASSRWIPEIGTLVVVRQLGSAEAEVIEVHPDANEITVKLGRISTRVSLASGVSKVDVSKTSWRR